MKILVTGGDGRFAKALKNENPNLYYTPGKFQLNLLENISVKRYTSIINQVDGIILNANTTPNPPTDWFNEEQVKNFNDIFNLYITSTNQLIQEYSPKLKFIIGLSTGLIDKKDKLYEPYSYIFGKELLTNHLFRLSCNEKYKHIKMFSINPGPMENEKEYEFHAKLMFDIVNNYKNYNNGEMYSIRDGISNDMVEEFMKSLSAEKNKSLI